MSDNYTTSLMRVFTAQFCQNLGFQSAMNSSLEILMDLMHRYMTDMCQNLRQTCTHVGRNQPTVDDLNVVFNGLGVNIQELQDYVSQTVGVPSEIKVPKYPVKRPHKLNFPPLRSREILGRPDYIPSYLPLMHPSKEKADSNPDIVDKSKGEKYDFATSFQAAGSNRMPSTGLDQEETFAPYDLDAFNTGLSDVVVVTPNFTSAGFSLPDDIIIYPSQQSETAETGDRSDRQSGSEPHQKRMKRNISDKINRHSTKIKRTTEIVSEFTAEGFISTASMEHQTTTSTYEAIETVVSVKSVEFTEQIRSPTEHIDDIIQSVIKVEDSDANTSSRLESLLTPTFQKQKFRNPYPERKRGSVKSRFGPKATGARIRPMPFSSQSVGETVASVAAQSALMAQQQLLQPLPVQLPIVILEPSLFPQNSADMSTGSTDTTFDEPLDLSKKSDSSEGTTTPRKTVQLEKMETYPASVPSTSQETVKERQVEPLVVKPFKISLKTVTGSGGDKGKEEKLKKKKEKEKEKDKITKPLTMKVKKEKKLGMLENVIQKLHDSSLSQIGSSQSSSLEINTVKQAVKIVEEVVISAAPVQPPLKMTFSKTPGPDELAIKKKKKKKKHLDEQRDDHQHRRPESTETQEVAVVPSAVAPAAIPKLKIIMKKPTEGSSKKSDKKRLNVVQMADESQPIVPRCPSPVLSVLSQFAERSGPAVTVETIGEQPSYDEVSSQFNIPSSPPKSPSLCSQSPTNLPSPAYDLTDTLPAKSPSPFHESPSIPIHFDTDEVVTRDVETPPRPTQSRPMERTPPDTPVSGVSTSTNVKSSGEETEETAWICPACSVAYADGVDMIACDNCDVWYHFACVGITQAPPADEKWYCGQCRKLANSNRGAFAKKKSTGPNMVGYGGKRKKAGGKK